jgi:response regulator RpfG family c-di-GMP phosphodiesterase
MRHASIFLVEDKALIRMMLVEMIEELGHRVVAEAGNIQDAQVLAETAIFNLAILDINIVGSSIVPVAEIIGACRSFLSSVTDQRPDRKHSLSDRRCRSRYRFRNLARQLTRSSQPLVRHRLPVTNLRRRFNKPPNAASHREESQ